MNYLRGMTVLLLAVSSISLQSIHAYSQVRNVDEIFDKDLTQEYQELSNVFGNNTTLLKQKIFGSIIVIISEDENYCNMSGCKTVIIDSSRAKNNILVILSNGYFHVSDSFYSKFGNGATVVFYKNTSRETVVKFLKDYMIVD